MSDLIQRWIRPEILALQAYHVPDASGLIKLDAMENPYTLDDAMQSQWLEALRNAPLNRYPDPEARALRDRLRVAMDVPRSAEIILGNGSDELIQIIAMAMAGPARTILAPEPTFVMYKMIATFAGMQFKGVPLKADFSLDMPMTLSAIEQTQPAIIFLAYPNNPTGNLFERSEVEAIIAAAPGLVVVDEAYHAFAGDSFMNDIERYENLVVMRTVSKMGLAGIRLGLLAGAPGWIGEFNKVRLPYNINVLTQLSGDFALRHQGVFDRQTFAICEQRAILLEQLAGYRELEVFPSQANFVLFRTPPGQAERIFEVLKQGKILIKNLSKQGGLLHDCLRVTVGTPEQNRAFLDVLGKALQSGESKAAARG